MKRFWGQIKGLYYFLRYAKAIPLPLTEGAISAFGSVMFSLRKGWPEDIQVGSWIQFQENPSPEDRMSGEEVIKYIENLTDDVYAMFQCYPIGETQIIYHPIGAMGVEDPLTQGATLAFKKRYRWEA